MKYFSRSEISKSLKKSTNYLAIFKAEAIRIFLSIFMKDYSVDRNSRSISIGSNTKTESKHSKDKRPI